LNAGAARHVCELRKFTAAWRLRRIIGGVASECSERKAGEKRKKDGSKTDEPLAAFHRRMEE
jgi:hypothetical protein